MLKNQLDGNQCKGREDTRVPVLVTPSDITHTDLYWG